MKIKNSNVLITGGASGIGKIMGRMALEKGAKSLIIWDINEKNIASTVEEFSVKGRVKGYRVDVGNIEAIREAYAIVVKECGDIDILINNAGIITGNKTFDQVDIAEIDRTMQINAIAPMYVAREILPDMLRRQQGHICNITSAGGMLGNPRMAVYGASKWAAIGWSDSVRIELQEQKSKVRVTTITPYYINTGMFDGVKSPILPILEPEATARTIIRAIERNKDFKGIPLGFHLIRLAQGLLPTSWFEFIFGRCFGIFSTMDNFTGRNK